MADVQVDELSIKLSSSLDSKLVSNLKSISDGLAKLHNSLTAFSASSSAIKSVDLMTNEFSKLATSIDKIDTGKIEKLAVSINKLSGAGNNIGKTFGGLSLSGAEKSLERYRKKAESVGDSLAKSLGISDAEGVAKAKDAVVELADAIYKWKTAGGEKPNTGNIGAVAKEYADALQFVSADAEKATSSVLEFIRATNASGNKILLPSEASSDPFYAQKRRTLGPAFTTDGSKGGTSLSSFIADYNTQSGSFIDPDLFEHEQFEELYKQVSAARAELEAYNQAALKTPEAQRAIGEEIRGAANELSKFATQTASFNSVLAEMGVDGGSASAFSNLKDALSGLSEIPALPDLSGISQLSKAVESFAKPEISTAVANMPTVITGISELTHGLAGVTVPDLSGISQLIDVIGGIGGKGIKGAISNLPQLGYATTQFADAMSQLPSVPLTVISDLGSISESIKKYSSKGVQSALPVLPQMGAAVKQLLNDIATAPPIDPSVAQTIQGLGNLNAQAIKGLIQLSNESEKSAKKVNILGKAFKGIGGAGKGFVSAIGKGVSALKNLKNHATNAGQNGFAQLTKSIVMVRTALWGLRRVASGFMSSINLASDLVEVNNVIDHVFGNYTTKIEEIADTSIEKFGISELTFKKTAGQFQAMASTMGITDDMVSSATQKLQEMGKAVDANGKYAYESNGKMQDMATSITEWVADIASFYDMDYSEAATKAQSIFTGTTRPLRSIGVDLTQANLKAWALANGLNADIEHMTQAEKATLRFQYALAATSVATGDFQRTAHTWANQVRILKEQFNALKTVIGTGLISALKPFVSAMNSAMSGIIDFAQNVINALGKIFGWEVEIANGGLKMDDAVADIGDLAGDLGDVADAGGDAAKGTDKASKALEEYKKQVLSFDELHMLSAPNENNSGGSGGSGGNGGSGGGSGSGASGSGGTASAGDVTVAFKRTKALYESEIDSLRELGTYIATTLKETLESIPWSDVYQGASNFGKGLADFLNGLLDPSTGVFDVIGETVGKGLNTVLFAADSFVSFFDAKNLGTDVATAINSALESFDWKTALKFGSKLGGKIGVAINSFISETDFELVGSSVANFIGIRINKASALFETLDFSAIGSGVGTAITSAIKTTDFAKVGKTASDAVLGAINGAAALLTSTDFKALGEGIRDAITNFDWPGFAEAGGKLIGSLLKAAKDAIGGLLGDWWSGIVKTFTDSFNDYVDDMTDAGVPLGKAVTDGVGVGIFNVLKDGATWVWDNICSPIINGFIKGFDIHSPSHVMIGFGGNLIEGLLLGITDAIKNIGTWIDTNIVSPFREKLSAFFGGKGTDGSSTLGEAAAFGSNFLESIKGGFGDVKGWVNDNIVSKFTEAFGGDGENGGLKTNVKLTASAEEDSSFGIVKTAWDSIVNKKSKITAEGADGSGGVLDKLKATWNKLVDKKPRITGKATDGNPKTFNRLTGIWDKVVTKKPLLTGRAKDGSGGVLGTLKAAWNKVVNKDATVKGYASNKNPSTLKTLQGSWEKVYDKNATLTAKANFNSYTSSIYPTINAEAKVTKVGLAADAQYSWEYLHAMGEAANGGIYAGGKWHDVASYAGGTVSAPTGQLFVAREAGPELVGSIGGHTAVMNNDQIVSSVANGVYTAVRSALSASNLGGGQAPVIEVIVKADNETLYRQVKRGERAYNGRYSTVATI